MFLILLFLFTVVPVVELYLLFEAGDYIGGFNTLLVVLVTGVIGASMAKKEGRQILNKIQTKMQSGQLPADDLFHGILVFGGGLLLLTPGFLTDFFGLTMVMPLTRLIYIRSLKRMAENMIQSGNIQFYSNVSSSNEGFENPFEGSAPRPTMRDVTPPKLKESINASKPDSKEENS